MSSAPLNAKIKATEDMDEQIPENSPLLEDLKKMKNCLKNYEKKWMIFMIN